VQGVFVKAYEKLSTYDPRHRFFSWIYKMMVNASLNWLESSRRLTTLDPELPAKGATPEGAFLREEESAQIEAALDRLKPEQKLAVVLKYFGDLSYDELSFVLDVPTKTVKSRLYEARRVLAGLLVESGVTHDYR
jgi:RNA polymerase sigma-70 factor, ECF subfamily